MALKPCRKEMDRLKAVFLQTPRRAGKTFHGPSVASMVSDPLEMSGFGDGDDGVGDGRGDGYGDCRKVFDIERNEGTAPSTPEHTGIMAGDGDGYGPRGMRCPGHQLTTTRSFNGHLTNIFLRGLLS